MHFLLIYPKLKDSLRDRRYAPALWQTGGLLVELYESKLTRTDSFLIAEIVFASKVLLVQYQLFSELSTRFIISSSLSCPECGKLSTNKVIDTIASVLSNISFESWPLGGSRDGLLAGNKL